MFHYRLYFRKNFDGPVVGSEEILARDDVDAVRLAGTKVGSEALELWRDKRKVKDFPPLDGDQASFLFEAR